MKKLIPLLFLIASCGFFKTDGNNLNQESTEAPPVVVSDKDPTKVLYSIPPPRTASGDYAPPIVQECDYEEFVFVITQTMKEQVLKDVWYTKEKVIQQYLEYPEFYNSDHLHIKSADLESVSGDNLFFISWIKSEMNDDLVIWSDNVYDAANPKIAELKYDGSRDLIEDMVFITDTMTMFEFLGTARGKSPSEDTNLEMHLLLSSFFNCR